ncbi:MAG: diguanylate cyclase [Clostridia bacterium]|nr:diguanylate cyclase [Clostridia bacterium]
MQKKTRQRYTGTFILVMSVLLLSTLLAMLSMNRMNAENRKDMSMLIAARVHDTISSSMTEPIMAAKTMASNGFLADFLVEEESSENEAGDVAKMQRYLSSVKERLGFDSAFTVSTKTSRYYTAVGLNKIVDPVNDPHDVWYSAFLEKNKSYDLDVDTDEVNGNLWTVFVNARIETDEGLVGVGGVGVQMTNIQDILSAYENQYGVKINLVDANGLVQVDTDTVKIENAWLNDIPVSAKTENEYIYNETGGKIIITKYVENLGWFLVVQSDDIKLDNDMKLMLLLNGGLFLILLVVFFAVGHATRRRTTVLLDNSYKDELTGLSNRRAYEEAISRLKKAPLPQGLVAVNADVNGLKEVNDRDGHNAGDVMIRAAADCLLQSFGEHGDVYRIGGDEFSALLNLTPDELASAMRCLTHILRSYRETLGFELSISIGTVPHWEDEALSLDEMIDKADERMYASKRAHYEKNGNDRRKN